MIRRLVWFMIGVGVGAVGTWQISRVLQSAKPSSVARQAQNWVVETQAKSARFLKEFDQARREAEVELRRQAGMMDAADEN
ncbi:MAG: hypothetical protein LBV06_03920 [Propionibacteriaceae bacterium]|jgi:uncharacterized protein HemX|nr:hypothetical protein [Propionibacteriaceae bacterium]